MFWNSVLQGLSTLLHWQTYIGVFIYLLIAFFPIIIISITGDKFNDLIEKYGYLLFLFIQPLFQAFGVFVTVCTLFPIMLGENNAAWSLPWILVGSEPIRVLILLFIMLVLSLLGAFMPILGRLNSFLMFIMGGAVLVFLMLSIQNNNSELGIQDIDLIPSWWVMVGIVIISGVTSWVGIIVSAAIVALLFRDDEGISTMIMMPMGTVFGFIPIFIYAAWIGVQIQGLK